MAIGRHQLVSAGRAQLVGADEHETAGDYSGYYAGQAPGAPVYGRPPMLPAHPGHPGREVHHHHHPHPGYGPGPQYGFPIPGAGSAAYSRGPERMRIIDEPPRHERQFPIGFLSQPGLPVLANSTQTITAAPQVIFRGERLAVPNSIVLNFQLVDIKIGKDSQLASPGNMPTECFSNISIGVRMQLDTAEPGITISHVAQNTDVNNPHSFASVLYGTVIE